MNRDQLEAVRIANAIFRALPFRPGESEKDVALRIGSLLKGYGAKPAFKTIVASGSRSSIPHGYATNKRIIKGEQVMIDFGALFNGRRSDITRTFFTGQPTAKQKKSTQ